MVFFHVELPKGFVHVLLLALSILSISASHVAVPKGFDGNENRGGVEASRLTGRRENGGAGGASWVISMIYIHILSINHISIYYP